jgi:hypothetical protein
MLRHAAALLALALARDVPANLVRARHPCIETPLIASVPAVRVVHWAGALEPVAVESFSTHAMALVRLYSRDGTVDEEARRAFERIAEPDGEGRPLDERLEQLVMKAAYHFRTARVRVVSTFRPHAGRHTSGEAIDFKLEGVSAATLAAYLRSLPRVGVGVYTHPRTQFVHLDVREPSYHWIDASPPGVRWHEARLRDPSCEKRDAAWTPEADLPI